MKTTIKNTKISFIAALAAGALSLLATHANAQITIQNFDDPTTINSFPAGTLDGFDFFSGVSAGVDYLSNPSYGAITNVLAGATIPTAPTAG